MIDPLCQRMFRRCYPNKQTTTELVEDGTSYVFTGDIPAMWLRDSTAQVRHYVPLAGGCRRAAHCRRAHCAPGDACGH